MKKSKKVASALLGVALTGATSLFAGQAGCGASGKKLIPEDAKSSKAGCGASGKENKAAQGACGASKAEDKAAKSSCGASK